MSGTARTVTIRIAVEDADARRKLEELGTKGPASLKQIEDAARSASPPMQGLAAVSDGLAQGLGRFGGVAGAASAGIAGLTAAAGAGIVAIARAGDEYTAAMSRLTSATGSAGAAGQVFRELQGLAAQTGVSVSESAAAFVRFSIAAREVGATNAEVLQLVRTIQQAGIIAGSSTQETQSAILQLGQALASGKLQGDELRSILESMPTLAEAMARELGVSVGQLRQMGAEGQLTADRVMPALLRAGERINREFQGIPPTISQAFGVLREATQGFLGQLDQALGLSQRIATALGGAAAALRGAQAAITAATPAQAAQAAQEGAQRQIAEIQRGIEAAQARVDGVQAQFRPRGEVTPERMAAAERAAAVDPAGQAAARDLAALRARLAEQQRIEQEATETRARLAREAQEAQGMEEATAAARRAEAQRRRATEEFNGVRDRLDRERALREEHRQAIARIDAGEAAGATDAAYAARLRARAEEELAEGLRKLEPAARAAATSRREGTEADREAQRQAEEGRRVTEGVRTEAEKYAAEVERLSGMLERGNITQETFNRAIQAADPALRAAREASERAQRSLEDFERRSTDAVTRIGETTMERLGGGLVNAFLAGERATVSFRSVALSTVASIGTELLKLGAINPIMNAALGGMRPTLAAGLPSLFGGTAQAAGTVAQGGGALEQAGMLASARSIYSGITGGITGSSFFSSAVPFSETGTLMGSTGLGSFLNTPIMGATPIFGAGTTTASTALLGSEAGSFVGANLAGSQGGLTIGSALGPAAAIGGGIYGVVSGIQRGGIGGYTSAAGGAISAVTGGAMLGSAMGLLPALGALGPAGLIAGAVLAIAGSLLPGAKESTRAQAAAVNMDTGGIRYDGNTRNFSQANRDEAENFARSIAALETALQTRTGYGLGLEARVGVDKNKLYLDVGNRGEEEFKRNDDGAKALADRAAALLWERFRESADRAPSAEVRGIILGSATAAEFDANLTWYEQTYKALTDATDATSTFATSLANLKKPYDEAIAKAEALGLATEKLTERRDREAAKVVEQRDAQLRDIELGLSARTAAARGEVDYGALAGLAKSQRLALNDNERRQLEDQLATMGIGTEGRTDLLARLGAAQDASFGAARTNTLRDISTALDIRRLRAGGDAQGADLMEFDAAARDNITQARAQLAAAEVDAADSVRVLLDLERTLADERLAIQRRYAEEAARVERERTEAARQQAGSVFQSLGSYANSLAISEANPGPFGDRFAAAERQFNRTRALALGGDAAALAELQGVSEAFRGVAREGFGGGAAYAEVFNRITDTLPFPRAAWMPGPRTSPAPRPTAW